MFWGHTLVTWTPCWELCFLLSGGGAFTCYFCIPLPLLSLIFLCGVVCVCVSVRLSVHMCINRGQKSILNVAQATYTLSFEAVSLTWLPRESPSLPHPLAVSGFQVGCQSILLLTWILGILLLWTESFSCGLQTTLSQKTHRDQLIVCRADK